MQGGIYNDLIGEQAKTIGRKFGYPVLIKKEAVSKEVFPQSRKEHKEKFYNEYEYFVAFVFVGNKKISFLRQPPCFLGYK